MGTCLALPSKEVRRLLSSVSRGMRIWYCIPLLILLSHLTAMPEILKAFLALPLLIIIPQWFGGLITRPVRRSVRGFCSDIFSEWMVSWLVGTFCLTMAALILQMFHLSSVIKNLPWLVVGIIIVSLIYDDIKERRCQRVVARYLPVALQDFKVTLLVLVIGLVPVLIYRYFGPFPLIRSGFALPKIVVQPVRRMIEDGYIMWNLPTHKSALIVMVAMVSALINVDPLPILWSGPFLLYAVFALGFYLWTYELSQHRLMSVLAALFGVFAMAAAPGFQGIPLRVRSSTVQYSLLPLFLYLVHKDVLKRDYRLGDMILALALACAAAVAFFFAGNLDRWVSAFSNSSRTQVYTLLSVALPLVALIFRSTILAKNQARDVFLFLVFLTAFLFQFHVFEAPLHLAAIFIYIGFYCLLRTATLRPVFRLAIALTWFFLILRLTGLLKIPEANLFSSATFGEDMFSTEGHDLSRKYADMMQAHGPPVLVLFALGTLSMALAGGQTELFIVSMVTHMSFLYFLPDRNTHRIHKEITPFMAYVLAWILSKPYRFLKLRLPIRTRKLGILMFALVAATVVLCLVYSFFDHYSAEPRADGSYPTIMADFEYEVTDWLRAHAPKNVRLVSDFYTMHVMTELADKVKLIELPINPAAMSEAGREQLWHIKTNVFLDADTHQIYNAILSLAGTEPDVEREYLLSTQQPLTDVTFVVVISGRTSQWIHSRGVRQVRSLQEADTDVDPVHLHKFDDLRYFSPLYQVGERVYVFEVNQPTSASQGSSRYYVNLGNLNWSQGDTQEAIAQYKKAIDTDPLDVEGYIALGEAHRTRGSFAEARAAFMEATRLAPDNVNLQMVLGKVCVRQGDLPRAIEAYQKAVALRPDLRDPHVALGRAYLQGGILENAVAQFEVAMELYSKDAELHADLGVAYAALGREVEAAAEYQQAVALGIDKPGYHYYAEGFLTAEILDELRTYETHYILVEEDKSLQAQLMAQSPLFSFLYRGDGLELYKVASELVPDQVVTGNAYLEQQEWDRAIVEFNEALRIQPDAIWAHVGLGRGYQSQGQIAQALGNYEKAITAGRVPPDSNVVESISRYLDIDPNYLSAYLALRERYQRGKDADLEDAKWAVWSFLDHDSQNALSNDQTHRSAFIIDGQPRGVLYQHPPSQTSYTLNVPVSADLRFSLALAPEVWRIDRGDGVQFDIYVEGESTLWHAFSEYIDPKNVPAHRRWHDREMDLSRWAGKTITVTFATGPGPCGNYDYDWAGWGEPRIVQPVAFDFLAEVPNADPGGADDERVRQGTLTIDYETREILIQHPPDRITYRVDVPEQTRLYFGLGLYPAVCSPGNGDGVEYNIYVLRSDEPHVFYRVFHTYLDSKNDPADRHWFDRVVDLTAFGGQSVDLVFEALPGLVSDENSDWGGWSQPVLVTGFSSVPGAD